MSTETSAFRTRGGAEWVPQYVTMIDQGRCIGCGRCYKACSRDVFQLVERVQDDDDDEEMTKVMSIADALDCIGCKACGKVCPKACITHETLVLAG